MDTGDAGSSMPNRIGIAGAFAVLAGATWLLSRRLYFTLAILLAGLVAISLAYLYLSQPTLLRVAVGPAEGKDARLMDAFANVLEAHRESVRLRPVVTAGLVENRALLEKGDVDLAIIRGDQGLPADTSVVMILRTDVLVVVAPSKSNLESLSQLKNKRLGLVVRTPLDEPGFQKLLLFYGMQSSDVKLSVIKPDEVAALTNGGRLDAVLVFGPLVDPEVTAIVYAVDAKKKKGPSILEIDLSGLAEKNTPSASEVTIPKHAFARRRVPDDEVNSIGVPTFLAGNTPRRPTLAKIRAQAVKELARNMIERRNELSQKVGYPVSIEKPDNEKGVRFPVHAGTSAYLDDTDISWYSLFSDQIWTVWLIGGTVASIWVAMLGFLRTPTKDPMQSYIDRLTAIASRAKTHPEEIDTLTDDLSEVATRLAALAYERKSGPEAFAPVQLAYENARFAIATAHERQAEHRFAAPAGFGGGANAPVSVR